MDSFCAWQPPLFHRYKRQRELKGSGSLELCLSDIIIQTHLGTATAEGPETVVGHVVAGGDVHLPQLVTVPGQAVAGVVSQAGAGPEVELVDVGTVPGEHQESVVSNRLEQRGE